METKQFIEQNAAIVPANQRKKFETLTEEQKVAKLKLWMDIAKMRAEAKEKNRLVNKVRELFDRRKASEKDAKEVIEYCETFIRTFKDREIEKIDEAIAQLQSQRELLTQ